MPGIACLLQMSDHEDTRSFAGPSTHLELLRLAWGCINKSLVLSGFVEHRVKGDHMVNGPDRYVHVEVVVGS